MLLYSILNMLFHKLILILSLITLALKMIYYTYSFKIDAQHSNNNDYQAK